MGPNPRAAVASGWIRPLATAVAVVLAVAGTAMVAIGAWPKPPPLRSVLVTVSTAAPPAAASDLGRSAPVELTIPSIELTTPVTDVGLNPDGTVELPPPSANAPAAWYRNLASPGERGPAVILGHVDSSSEGPAVFFRLVEVAPGATVQVRRADGRIVTFTVTAVGQYPKSNFPSAAVYGPVAEPQLRLVTCGGTFDATRRSYEDNIVVFATFAGAL